MRPIVNELKRLGYPAEHRFLISSASYRKANTIRKRIWLRIQMYLLYPAYFLYVETKARSSHMIVCTNTFYTPFLSTLLRSKQRHPIHLLYDLFPDALVSAGKLRRDSLIARAINLVVDATLSRSSANVILGCRLKVNLGSRLPAGVLAEVIPVGTDCTPFPPYKPAPVKPAGPIKLLYCGNLGHLHDVNTLAACIRNARVGTLPISFHFYGNGAGMTQLKASAKNHPLVCFAGALSEDEWINTMSSIPIGLVTMRPGAEAILLPSKTYSAMAAGQAILAICPRKSDLADLVHDHDCGWVIEPNDVDSLIETLETIVAQPLEVQRKRQNAQAAALQHYDARPVASLWSKLFQQLEIDPCPTL